MSAHTESLLEETGAVLAGAPVGYLILYVYDIPESRDFYERRLGLRVIEADEDGPARGASTIPMQTAKNLFLWPSRSYIRKGLELHRERPFACIVVYSHMLPALAGIVLKWLTGARRVLSSKASINASISD